MWFEEIMRLRAYFRIQGKRPICSKSASYFGFVSWSDSSTSMKIQSISGNWFKQVIGSANTFMLYCCCLQFLISSLRFWEYLMMVETEVKRFLTHLFLNKLQICHYRIVKSTKEFWKKIVKVYSPWLGNKKWSLEPLKRLFHHSENTSFCKN